MSGIGSGGQFQNRLDPNLEEVPQIKAVSIIANGSVVHAEVVTLSGDKYDGDGVIETIEGAYVWQVSFSVLVVIE